TPRSGAAQIQRFLAAHPEIPIDIAEDRIPPLVRQTVSDFPSLSVVDAAKSRAASEPDLARRIHVNARRFEWSPSEPKFFFRSDRESALGRDIEHTCCI